MQTPDPIPLSADELAKACNGKWHNLPEALPPVSGVASVRRAQPGFLCITVDRSSKWKKFGLPVTTSKDLQRAAEAGAIAFVVGKNINYDTPLPLLEVEDTWNALRGIACSNRESTSATRIFVTGSVGKTSYKLMARHAFAPQVRIYATTSSANLNVAIWSSLASLTERDELAIFEASVANPNRGRQRSAFVKPHICVFTNISQSHTSYHGSIDNLIHHKAESIIGLEPGGLCLMNADHAYFSALKNEVQRLRPVPVMTWGRESFCDARLLSSEFDPAGYRWLVSAEILGRTYRYAIGTYHAFAPVASLGVLLTAAVTDLDVSEVADSLASFEPGDTAGSIIELDDGERPFTLFDYSLRGSIEGFRAALSDLYRLTPADRRILLALGECRDLSKDDHQYVHREIASLIDTARSKKLFTVGDGMLITRKQLADSGILAEHGDKPEDITKVLLDEIRPNDVVFIQGHHRVWMSRIADRIKKSWKPVSPRTASPSSGNRPEAATRSLASIPTRRFIAGGDFMLARDFPGSLYEKGADWVFGTLGKRLRAADGVLVNLECVISRTGDFVLKPGGRRPFHYHAPAEVGQVFSRGGITVVNTANNHSMDFGAAALNDQTAFLDSLGIVQVGSGQNRKEAERWIIHKCGDVDVAIIGFETTAPWASAREQQGGVLHLPHSLEAMKTLAPIISQARQHAHIVIVTVHWGSNWKEAPGKRTVALARALINAGVDAVLGHSAHILQGVEIYKGRPIAYDMGSFVFDRVRENRLRESALFELTFSRHGLHGLTLVPIRLYRSRVRPAGAEYADRILDLLEKLTLELNQGTPPLRQNESLYFPLSPDKEPRHVTVPPAKVPIIIPGSNKTATGKPGYVEPEPAVLAAEGTVLSLGNGLEIGGYRHPQEVKPKHGFLFELRFRFLLPVDRRWRSELLFLPEQGDPAVSYRYPLCNGLWNPALSGQERWFADRTLIRTPLTVGPGRYQLYWNLWSRDQQGKRVYWSAGQPKESHTGSWIRTGTLLVSNECPPGVGGIAHSEELVFQDSVLGTPEQ